MSEVKSRETDGGETEGLSDPGQRRGLQHPKPDTPESKVEHQADQPGVTTGSKS